MRKSLLMDLDMGQLGAIGNHVADLKRIVESETLRSAVLSVSAYFKEGKLPTEPEQAQFERHARLVRYEQSVRDAVRSKR